MAVELATLDCADVGDVGLFLLAAAMIAAVLVDLELVLAVLVVVVAVFEFEVVDDEDESS